jgi:hypothetical protein
VQVELDDEVDGCTFSRDGRQLVLICGRRSLRICPVSNAQLIKVIHLVGDRQESFVLLGLRPMGANSHVLE